MQRSSWNIHFLFLLHPFRYTIRLSRKTHVPSLHPALLESTSILYSNIARATQGNTVNLGSNDRLGPTCVTQLDGTHTSPCLTRSEVDDTHYHFLIDFNLFTLSPESGIATRARWVANRMTGQCWSRLTATAEIGTFNCTPPTESIGTRVYKEAAGSSISFSCCTPIRLSSKSYFSSYHPALFASIHP